MSELVESLSGEQRLNVNLRGAQASDAYDCGRIIYAAFNGIADQHNFPHDFPNVEAANFLAQHFINHPAIYAVVAESDGQLIGSNFLDERNAVRGVGPISVDTQVQGSGAGRRLMQAVIERGRGAHGIRLVQDAFNMASMSLYASLGFEVKEPLVLMKGTLAEPLSTEFEVRRLRFEDLEECADLCRRVHGFDRVYELRDALEALSPMVAVREGRITAYASAPTFWPLNHAVAETEADMCALLSGAGAQNDEPLSFLLPTRQAGFFRWCLSRGLRGVKPLTLMALGEYKEPQGCFFPSVMY